MKSLTVLILTVIVLNVAAIDVVAYKVDRNFRLERDYVCDHSSPSAQPVEVPLGAVPSTFGYVITVPTHIHFDLMVFEINYPERIHSLHLYGCDVNGHKYRIWEERP